jgi:hypothetical protein
MSTQVDPITALVREVEADYQGWYEKSVRRVAFSFVILQAFAVFSGFIVALLTALVDKEHFETYKPAFVIVPALGSLAATILVQFRVRDLLRLREEGRIAFQSLSLYSRGRLLGASSSSAKQRLYEEIAMSVGAIEKDQSDRFFSLVKSDFVAEFMPWSKRPDQRNSDGGSNREGGDSNDRATTERESKGSVEQNGESVGDRQAPDVA